MSESLPKWIKGRAIDDRVFCQQLYDALSIAWEALEELKGIRYESRAKEFVEDRDYPAKDAMRRIEELGR